MCDPGSLFFWDCGKDFVSHAEISPHHSSLIFEHWDQQRVTNNVQLFIAQIQPVVLGDIPQEIHCSGTKQRALTQLQQIHTNSLYKTMPVVLLVARILPSNTLLFLDVLFHTALFIPPELHCCLTTPNLFPPLVLKQGTAAAARVHLEPLSLREPRTL